MQSKLILVLVLSIAIQGSKDNPVASSNDNYETNKIRMKRASQEDFSTTVSQMATAARLITAISLQNGLIDGTIPPDNALAEMLNIGSVDIAKFETFDKTKIDGFMGTLAGLKLNGSDEVTKLEAMVPLIESWRQKYENVGGVKDVQLANDYFTSVTQLQGKTLARDIVDALGTSILKYIGSLTTLSRATADPNRPQRPGTNLLVDLQMVESSIEFAEKFDEQLSSWKTSLSTFDSLSKSAFPLNSPQFKFKKILDDFDGKRTSLDVPSHSTQQEVADIISRVYTALSDPNAPIAHLVNLGELTSHHDATTTLKYTSGFVNGYLDLEKILNDAVDPSVKPFLGGLNQTTLKSGLVLLETMSGATSELLNSWNPLWTVKSMESGKKVELMMEILGSIKSKTTVSEVKSVAECGDRPNIRLDFANLLEDVFKDSIKLRSALVIFDQKTEQLAKSSAVKDLKLFTQLKEFLPSNTSTDTESQKLSKFGEFNETQKLINTLTALQSLVKALNDEIVTTNITQLVTGMSGREQVVKDFASHPTTDKWISYFDKYKTVSGDIKSVEASIQLVGITRELIKDTHVSVMSNALATSVPKVKALRSIPESIKANKDAAVVELTKLKNFGSAAKDYGELVRMVDNIRKVLEKKTDLEKFLTDGGTVEGKIKAEPDAAKKQEMLDGWGDFEETKAKVTQLLNDFERQRNSIQTTTRHRRATGPSSKFADYSATLSSFPNLQDVDLQVEKRLEVLNQLAGFDDLKANLGRLGSLDLQFAKFNPLTASTAVTQTLSSLDSAFVRGGGSLGPATPGPVPTGRGGPTQRTALGSPNAKGPQGSLGSQSSSTPASSDNTLLIVGCVIGGLVLIAIIVGLIYWYRKKKANKNDAEAGKSKRIAINSNGSATTPTVTVDGDLQRVKTAEEKAQEEAQKREEAEKQREEAEKQREEAEQQREEADQQRQEAEEGRAEAQAALKARPKVTILKRNKKIRPIGDPKPEVADPAANTRLQREAMCLDIGYVYNDEKQVIEYLKDAYCKNPRFLTFIKDFVWEIPKYLTVVNKTTDRTMKAQYYEQRAAHPPASKYPGIFLPASRNPNLHFINATRIYYIGGVLHANRIVCPLAGIYFVSEAPSNGTERPGAENTCQMYLKMLMFFEIPDVVMCCGLEESAQYFPTKLKTTLKIGYFEVELMDQQKLKNGHLYWRKLKITDTKTKKFWRVNHWQFAKWAKDQIYVDNFGTNPKDIPFLSAFDEVHQQTQHKKKPIAVHSQSGTGRAAMFVCPQVITQSLMDLRTLPDIDRTVGEIRSSRFGMIENGKQWVFSACMALRWQERLLHYRLEHLEYHAPLYFQWDVLRDYDDMGAPEQEDREALRKLQTENIKAERTARDRSVMSNASGIAPAP